MKTKTRRIIYMSMLVILLLVLGTGVAGAVAKSNLAKQHPAPGQLVDVGGYKLHINCVGEGSPTVILAAGLVDFSLTWTYVQPEVAKTTRVCSYDRAGLGWSELSPHPRTASNQAEELHTLLVTANVQGPYVLVGHSLGGMLMRVYAQDYPEEVVGMVLVDSLHEDQPIRFGPELTKKILQLQIDQFRMLAVLSSTGLTALAPRFIPNPGIPEDSYAQYQAVLAKYTFYEATIAEMTALEETSAEVRNLQETGFGNLPLIVLSRGDSNSTSLLTEAENQKMWEVWQEMQSKLVPLSSDGKQIIAERSGHNIQLDQPDLVINAIHEMVDALRERSSE